MVVQKLLLLDEAQVLLDLAPVHDLQTPVLVLIARCQVTAALVSPHPGAVDCLDNLAIFIVDRPAWIVADLTLESASANRNRSDIATHEYRIDTATLETTL
jgi:hypothetical protein